MYLVAIMDTFSRYVATWAVSITMEAHFCADRGGHLIDEFYDFS